MKAGAIKARPIGEYLNFMRGAFANPRGVGAIAPSSTGLGDAIAAQIALAGTDPVLELGPGSGAVTRGILRRGIAPGRLTVIEWDSTFVDGLRTNHPGVNVIQGDAFALEKTLADHHVSGPFAAIVSCLPLLNFPQGRRTALLEACMKHLAPGAPLIQFTYGFGRPAQAPSGVQATMAALVLKNLPPARVWVYRVGNPS